VAAAGHHSGAIVLGSPYVEDLQGHIVRHGSDPVLHDGMVLNVVDDVGVMSELSGRLDRLGAGILGSSILQVPAMGSVRGSLEGLALYYGLG
jgi:hypothetical protein